MWMSVPLAAAGALTFTTPNLDGGGKLVYAYVTYNVPMMIIRPNIPYGAMLGVITPNVKQRTTVSTCKLVGAFMGGTIFTPLIQEIFPILGRGDDAAGWQRAIVLFGAIAVGLMLADRKFKLLFASFGSDNPAFCRLGPRAAVSDARPPD